MTPDDTDALVDLFEHLTEDDLYCRFFERHLPPRPMIEKMTSASERNGFRLIAEIQRPDDGRRIVAEVGYEPLPDGDGELGITVAPDSRGWLGPYLLDALTKVAREAGVPNLQADVLLENHRMLTLVHSRGYATMDHSSGPAMVRVLIGAAQRLPMWPKRDGRPRVLVEVQGARWHAEEEARASGLQVLVCPGPLSKWSRCPAISGRRCPLAANADVIVDAVDAEAGAGMDLLDAHTVLHAGIPLCVELAGAEHPRLGHAEIIQGMTDTEVVRLVRHVARKHAPACGLDAHSPACR